MPDKKLLRFEKLQIEHVREMVNWGNHENPLLFDYNFHQRYEDGFKLFYLDKTISPFNKYFAVIYDEMVIGYLGIKKINIITKNSTLGIVLDPGLVGEGFGTMVLSEFLKIYFTSFNMKKMVLEVAAYNPRAKRLYENMGFVEAGYYLDKYPNEPPDEFDPYYLEFKDVFVKKDNTLYNYIHRMELRKEDFNFEVHS